MYKEDPELENNNKTGWGILSWEPAYPSTIENSPKPMTKSRLSLRGYETVKIVTRQVKTRLDSSDLPLAKK